MPWLVKPYSRRHLTREEPTTGYPGAEGGKECLWSISWKVHGTADDHGAEAKSCEGHCVNMVFYITY